MKAVPEMHDRGIRFESLWKSSKVLCIWLTVIDETGERGFVYKCKLSIALIYLAGMFLNKLKIKFNSFLQSGFKYKKNS